MWYVYLLKSQKDKKLYIGSTDSIPRRFDEHNKGRVKSTKFRRPWELVYFESYVTEHSARLREQKLKQFGAAYKELKKRLPEMSFDYWTPLQGPAAGWIVETDQDLLESTPIEPNQESVTADGGGIENQEETVSRNQETENSEQVTPPVEETPLEEPVVEEPAAEAPAEGEETP